MIICSIRHASGDRSLWVATTFDNPVADKRTVLYFDAVSLSQSPALTSLSPLSGAYASVEDPTVPSPEQLELARLRKESTAAAQVETALRLELRTLQEELAQFASAAREQRGLRDKTVDSEAATLNSLAELNTEESKGVALASQESGVDAFSLSGVLSSTLSSYTSSEPATRTSSLGAFEFAGLGTRAPGLPSVSEKEVPPEPKERNVGAKGESLLGALLEASKPVPSDVAPVDSAADAVGLYSVDCNTEWSFEAGQTAERSSGGSVTSGKHVEDAGSQTLALLAEESGTEGSQRKDPLVWAWNPVAIPPSPTGTPERTPQGSFDLPVRVNRVESMLSESGKGAQGPIPGCTDSAVGMSGKTSSGVLRQTFSREQSRSEAVSFDLPRAGQPAGKHSGGQLQRQRPGRPR